jgi:hypothetical protein
LGETEASAFRKSSSSPTAASKRPPISQSESQQDERHRETPKKMVHARGLNLPQSRLSVHLRRPTEAIEVAQALLCGRRRPLKFFRWETFRHPGLLSLAGAADFSDSYISGFSPHFHRSAAPTRKIAPKRNSIWIVHISRLLGQLRARLTHLRA